MTHAPLRGAGAALSAHDLTFFYPATDEPALSGVDFAVPGGTLLGVVGPTGAGKTTLGMCLRGLAPFSTGGRLEGEVRVGGELITKGAEVLLASTVGMVFQNADTQIVSSTVAEDLAFGLGNLGVPQEEMWRRVRRVASLVGLEGLLHRNTWVLSGGQKQRLAIGGALITEPEVLILDEPTSELDPANKAAVFEVVSRLKAEADLTIVMIEHEVEELARIADALLLLSEGRQVLHGTPTNVFRRLDVFEAAGERVPAWIEVAAPLIEEGLLPPSALSADEESSTASLAAALGPEVSHRNA